MLKRNPGEPEFQQAVKEVLDSLVPVLERRSEYVEAKILDRIVQEPPTQKNQPDKDCSDKSDVV